MKYIIEFEDEPCDYEGGRLFYTCKQIPYWSVDKSKINKLPPYTEPDRQVVENEVWELAKACCDIMDYEWQLDTYQQAKSKIEEWEKSNDKTRFGDEVIPKNKDGHGEKGVVLSLYQPKQYKPLADVLWCDGTVDKMVVVEKLVRTGRHFDHIERMLEGMRNE